MSPQAEWSRPVFHQWTQRAVAASTSSMLVRHLGLVERHPVTPRRVVDPSLSDTMFKIPCTNEMPHG